MKSLRLTSILIIIVALVSACAPEAAPTMSAADVQSTAVSVAGTIVAQTQAAIPTATLIPPTETPTSTPLPTDTPVALPTLEVSPTTAAAANNPSGDPCATRVLAASPKGKGTIIRIWNNTKVPVTVSLYLNETASHGECGYRAYNLAKNSDVIITDLVQGCYNLWAWSTDAKKPFNSSGAGCINNPDKWTFEITTSAIRDTGP